MTEKERERLSEMLNALQDAHETIEAALAPFRKAESLIAEARELLLDQHDAELAGRCDACARPLFVGDQGHRIEDVGVFCAEHAPSWAEVEQYWQEAPPDPDDEEYTERRRHFRASLEAHLAAGGSRDDKILYAL